MLITILIATAMHILQYELVRMTGSVFDPAPTASSDLSILHLSSNIVHILKFRQYVGSPCFLRSSVLQVWPGPPFHPLSELQYPSHHLTLFTSFPKVVFLLSCQGSIYSPPPISNLICKVLSKTFIPTFLSTYHIGLQ